MDVYSNRGMVARAGLVQLRRKAQVSKLLAER